MQSANMQKHAGHLGGKEGRCSWWRAIETQPGMKLRGTDFRKSENRLVRMLKKRIALHFISTSTKQHPHFPSQQQTKKAMASQRKVLLKVLDRSSFKQEASMRAVATLPFMSRN
jgi:hypothetical protein